MFEHYSKPLIPQADYHRRLVGAASLALLLIAGSLGVGMLGYHAIEGQSWVDAYLSAAMILSFMALRKALSSAETCPFTSLRSELSSAVLACSWARV